MGLELSRTIETVAVTFAVNSGVRPFEAWIKSWKDKIIATDVQYQIFKASNATMRLYNWI